MPNPDHRRLSLAPTLIEIFRGKNSLGLPLIECVHHGLIAIADSNGNIIFSHGDADTVVHMRSCAKPLQVLPLLETAIRNNEIDHISEPDLALFMSSHSGEDRHTSRVLEILQELSLSESDLRCGSHQPHDPKARLQLLKDGRQPSAVHNNCSGKHVGMLLCCQMAGLSINDYENIDHPLQRAIRSMVAEFSGLPIDAIDFGIDGCSLPSWAIPINKIALIYARLAGWQSPSASAPPWLADALKRIWRSASDHPEFLSGSHCFDTELIKASKGKMLSKVGADGMQAISLLPSKRHPKGLGIAIKVADGDGKNRIRPLIARDILAGLSVWPGGEELERFLPDFKNHRRAVTGGYLASYANIG